MAQWRWDRRRADRTGLYVISEDGLQNRRWMSNVSVSMHNATGDKAAYSPGVRDPSLIDRWLPDTGLQQCMLADGMRRAVCGMRRSVGVNKMGHGTGFSTESQGPSDIRRCGARK